MRKNINKLIPPAGLFLLAIVLGITLPRFLFHQNVETFQIILTIIFVTPIIYFTILIAYRDYIVMKEKLQKSLNIRDEMLHISDIITSAPNTEELLQIILEKAVKLVDNAHKGSIMVVNKENRLEFKALIGYDEKKFENISFDLRDSFLFRKSKGKITKPCIIRDVQSLNQGILDKITYNALEQAEGLTIKTTISAPLIIDGVLYGMLNVDSYNKNAFNREDVAIIDFISNQAEINIKAHKLIDRILYLSRYDDLTDAFNRRYFEESFGSFVKCSRTFSLVYFDLNNLKTINDSFGHDIGDQAILTFVDTIKKNIRDTDLLARYGGDEFVALFFDIDQELVEKRIQNIRQQLEKSPLSVRNNRIIIKFSYGVASYPKDLGKLKDLIKLADKRMYQCKERFKKVN